MAIIKSGNSTDNLTVDGTSKAARVTLYNLDGTVQNPAARSSYIAHSAAFVPGSTPGDVFTVAGSATKLVKIFRMTLSGIQNPGGVNSWFVVKRSTANSGGTSSVVAAISSDNNDPAATAVVRAYTADPTLGALVGNAWSGKIASPVSSTGTLGTIVGAAIDFVEVLGKPIVLRSVNDILAWNFNSAALPAATSIICGVRWTEE